MAHFLSRGRKAPLRCARLGRAERAASYIAVCCLAALAGAKVLAAKPDSTVRLGDDASEASRMIAEFAEAGEFAPALELARRIDSRERRDRRLQQIAAAQVRAGARTAALNTAAEMSSDLARQQSLREADSLPPGGARGGAGIADFTQLIDLITSTINPPSWDVNGGPGAIGPFPGGVRVDADGVMRRVSQTDATGRLASLRREAEHERISADVRRASALRMVSLPRLEREVQIRLAQGRPLDEDMLLLAGLQRVTHVLVYPESGDLALAGPAGDWKADLEGRAVGVDTGRPLVRLEDLVVIWRHMNSAADAEFGCSITPTKEALAAAQAYIDSTKSQPLKPGQRNAWLDNLRSQLGRQKVEVAGIDPHSRVAQLMLEADYRMKLVGIGLEPGTLGVPSYLALIEVPAGQAPPPLGVVRWWFTMDYQALVASPQRDAFQLRGQGVRVQSENELLRQDGQRVATGQAHEPNQEFARRFTKDFAALAEKYPIYAELQNIFDLALVCAAIRAEGLPDQVDWHATCFGDSERFPVAAGNLPESVDTVINHRMINRMHVVAAVSGGVQANPWQWVKRGAIQTDRRGDLGSQRARATPHDVPARGWWWD